MTITTTIHEIYTTSDGCEFSIKNDAIAHEDKEAQASNKIGAFIENIDHTVKEFSFYHPLRFMITKLIVMHRVELLSVLKEVKEDDLLVDIQRLGGR